MNWMFLCWTNCLGPDHWQPSICVWLSVCATRGSPIRRFRKDLPPFCSLHRWSSLADKQSSKIQLLSLSLYSMISFFLCAFGVLSLLSSYWQWTFRVSSISLELGLSPILSCGHPELLTATLPRLLSASFSRFRPMDIIFYTWNMKLLCLYWRISRKLWTW